MAEHTEYGTAYVYRERRNPDDLESAWCWTGYIDRARAGHSAEPGMVAQMPRFDTDAEAIAWALERTPVVVIYDEDNKPYWAGAGPAPEDVPDLWADRRDDL
ncbi:hypothetical protein [Thermoactinospora rubra]|uniref:hypothetical protein n=1 Tax=Thermoactinospora rubra TaxID=1088767 RepID=UPI000A0F5A19|nr:hypothetical protein [Thermoactinospora rubra]